MKGKQIRTKSILQLEFYITKQETFVQGCKPPQNTPKTYCRWPQKEREETFETQKALPKGHPRDKISMVSEKKQASKS